MSDLQRDPELQRPYLMTPPFTRQNRYRLLKWKVAMSESECAGLTVDLSSYTSKRMRKHQRSRRRIGALVLCRCSTTALKTSTIRPKKNGRRKWRSTPRRRGQPDSHRRARITQFDSILCAAQRCSSALVVVGFLVLVLAGAHTTHAGAALVCAVGKRATLIISSLV